MQKPQKTLFSQSIFYPGSKSFKWKEIPWWNSEIWEAYSYSRMSEKETAPASALPVITLMICKMCFTEPYFWGLKTFQYVVLYFWQTLRAAGPDQRAVYTVLASGQQVDLSSLTNPNSVGQPGALRKTGQTSLAFSEVLESFVFSKPIHPQILRVTAFGQSMAYNKWAILSAMLATNDSNFPFHVEKFGGWFIVKILQIMKKMKSDVF